MSIAHTKQPPKEIPPLVEGDRLDRVEFERRYSAMPEHIKAELIKGIVHMASPARHDLHGKQHLRFIGFIYNYMAETPGTDGGDNSSLRLEMESEPQPDAHLRILEEAGGHSTLDAEGYLNGGPEFIAEVAASSKSYDLGAKKDVYRDAGVLEYLVWRVEDQAIDWFALRDGEYFQLTPDDDGIIKSQVFPGLWLNVAAMVGDDLPSVQATLQQGLASAEHQEFIAELARRMTSQT